jgi:hypothetical protein
MYSAILVINLILPIGPAPRDREINETESRRFDIPFVVAEEKRSEFQQVRLFVSRDRGATWKHYQDASSTATRFSVHVPEDGLYWFALQIIDKNGKALPASLVPHCKVRVVSPSAEKLEKQLVDIMEMIAACQARDANRKVDKRVSPTFAQMLQREADELRSRIEELRKKSKASETARKNGK